VKTDQLIEAIVADTGTRRAPMGRMLALALGIGAALATALFLATMGVRDDVGEAALTWRFALKTLLVTVVFVTAVMEVRRLWQPTAVHGWHWSWGVLAGLALVAVGSELVMSPMSEWDERLFGDNAMLCLTRVPMLAALPLVVLLLVARQGAPRVPALAGAAVGRLAAAVGLVLYALHCVDDSPLFVVTWYGLATAGVMAIGALVGARMLRW
jgi:hypothetical protein